MKPASQRCWHRMKARSLAHQVQLSRGGVVRIEPVTPSRPVKARIANARASAKAGFGQKRKLTKVRFGRLGHFGCGPKAILVGLP